MRVQIQAVDLFCGAGGLTHGLVRSGVRVNAGFDTDPECAFAYETNNPSVFFNQDVDTLSSEELKKHWDIGGVSLLAGCAPCQPFSTYMHGKKRIQGDAKWKLLYSFARLVEESSPDLVTMENVPALCKTDVFYDFSKALKNSGYHVWHDVVRCVDYGIPQDRKRLVLMASKFGDVSLIPPTHAHPVSVREAIGHLPFLAAGERNIHDPLHMTSQLSDLNLKRIRCSKPGGSWRDWPEELRAACHSRQSGERYGSVYGRMRWEQPSPTMTTQCYGYGNGRFGHPEQDRAISLREAAIFQTFPNDYQFFQGDSYLSVGNIGRLIGNAVPVRLGEVIGISLRQHLEKQTS